MSKSRNYNGWENYETWLTALWLDNDPVTYDLVRQYAREAKKAKKRRYETDESRLAESIKYFIEDNNPKADGADLYTDLISAAISEINFFEIAQNILSE